ncbi:hypothetical protein BLOT_012860 [Blomia tropicalis]|nr:hypothetical protein BLOT_012860 [Blomia tropicalis]
MQTTNVNGKKVKMNDLWHNRFAIHFGMNVRTESSAKYDSDPASCLLCTHIKLFHRKEIEMSNSLIPNSSSKGPSGNVVINPYKNVTVVEHGIAFVDLKDTP